MAMTPSEAAAKGLGWVPENHPLYGTPGFAGYEAPAAPSPSPAPSPAPAPAAPPPAPYVPPPSAPTATREVTPPVGPMTIPPYVPPTWAPETTRAEPPATGPMTAPPPVAVPERVAAPDLGPLVDHGGYATHEPTPPVAVPFDAPAPLPTPAEPVAAPQSNNPAAPATTVNDAFKKALLDRLNKPIGFDPNDPVFKAQSDAYHLAQTRAKNRDRETMASRAGATGQISDLAGSGAFDEGLSNLEQRQGEAEAGFNANLAGSELSKQRDELYRYAALAGSTLSGEEGRALTEKLANLDAEIRREGMAQSGSQFDRSFAQSAKQWEDSFGLEGKKLGETIRQFDTTTQAGRDALKQQLDIFKASQAQQGKEFDVDAELRKLGINQQGALGQGDLDLRRFLGTGGLNLNLLQLLLGNQQFGQNLGAQLGMFGAGQDADLWRALLGGLG